MSGGGGGGGVIKEILNKKVEKVSVAWAMGWGGGHEGDPRQEGRESTCSMTNGGMKEILDKIKYVEPRFSICVSLYMYEFGVPLIFLESGLTLKITQIQLLHKIP